MSRFGYLLLLLATLFALPLPAEAQSPCATNYCIRSQSTSYQTPPSWPNVAIASCCNTQWGSLPDALDWNSGAPIMICSASADHDNAYPNCGDPKNLSVPFALSYDRPKIQIGVAWPNPKNFSYEVVSIPLMAGADGTCNEYAQHARKVTNSWVYEIKNPKRGSYVFTAAVSFEKDPKGYFAVLNDCKLQPPRETSAAQ